MDMHIALDRPRDDLSPLNERYDVCIIGTGPAGSTLARELATSGLRVVLVESGYHDRRPESDALDLIESVGWPRIEDQWEARNRILGGASHTWGGRCAPFDEIDFETRPWVPMSGWPIGQDELSPYLDRSADHLGLNAGQGFEGENFWEFAKLGAPAFQPDSSKILPFFWQFSRDHKSREYMRFGRRLLEDLAGKVTVVTGATVFNIELDETGEAVAGVACVARGREPLMIAARTVALCAGGIENARLLLASNSVQPAGLGNRHDHVGRYLMDHPRGPVGTFSLADSETLQNALGRYNVRGNIFRAGFRLSPERQREEKLLNCSAWLGEQVAEDDPWEAVKRIVGRRPRGLSDVTTLVRQRALFARGLRSYFRSGSGIARKLDAIRLDCMCEQRPDRDSRITLSDIKDEFGFPIARIDWRVHEEESRTMRRMAELVQAEFARMNLPPLKLEDWVVNGEHFPKSFVDVAHPTGTTRMAQTPETGVVDTKCEVFGVRGLYVSGSSVFPTAGHCNPTQLIVAMAIRLADHLRVAADRPVPVPAKAAAPGEPRPRVLVTGATGLIGSHVATDLQSLGYRVRATTSRAAVVAERRNDGVEWVHFDLHEGGDYDGLVSGCDGVIHVAAEMHSHAKMERTNVQGTRDLVQAAERAGVKAFCYTSSISVYGSGLQPTAHEDSPVLTLGRDVKAEYWGDDGIRTYGRCKLGGEVAIRENARDVRYVIMRPAVVVDVDGIIKLREWPLSKRLFAAHRHSHHVYVRDVSAALVWSMEQGLQGVGEPGSVTVYNVAEDDSPEPRHVQFMRRAYAVTRDARYLPVQAPWFVDWTRDYLKYGSRPFRNPLWRMRYPSEKLCRAGFRFPFGMKFAYKAAIQQLKLERETRSARSK
jgi:choline dehydrogenase-like flavoprotein/nucleoside-diphosphate-sugar epimerase